MENLDVVVRINESQDNWILNNSSESFRVLSEQFHVTF